MSPKNIRHRWHAFIAQDPISSSLSSAVKQKTHKTVIRVDWYFYYLLYADMHFWVLESYMYMKVTKKRARAQWLLFTLTSM